MLLSRLKVQDQDFLVDSLIERCPRVTMLRELVMNGIEAARNAPAGARQVTLGTLALGGGRKLRIWNTGPGLDADELFAIGDMSSSIGKAKGLDGNFGIGAKVSTLASSPLGVRYRSCAGGRVHEMLLGRRDGAYGRVFQADRKGTMRPILDVTDEVTADGASLDFDWTEVVLLGHRADQDTAADPYDGNPPMDAHWVAEDLYHRFFHIDPGVTITIEDDLNWFGEAREFIPLPLRHAAIGRREVAAAPHGVRIHYLYDPPLPDNPFLTEAGVDALQFCRGLVALVYRGEMYSVLAGSAWANSAPAFGIPFGARHVNIVVELPDDYGVFPDTYRQFLRKQGEQKGTLSIDRFSSIIRSHLPSWLLNSLNGLAESRELNREILADLANLAITLGLNVIWKATTFSLQLPSGNEIPLPEVVLLRDEEELRSRWLMGRTAEYLPTSNQLFVNVACSELAALVAGMNAGETLSDGHGGRSEHAIRLAAEARLTRRVLRGVVFAISKQAHQDWGAVHLEKVMSSEALTMICMDLSEEAGMALHEMVTPH